MAPDDPRDIFVLGFFFSLTALENVHMEVAGTLKLRSAHSNSVIIEAFIIRRHAKQDKKRNDRRIMSAEVQ